MATIFGLLLTLQQQIFCLAFTIETKQQPITLTTKNTITPKTITTTTLTPPLEQGETISRKCFFNSLLSSGASFAGLTLSGVLLPSSSVLALEGTDNEISSSEDSNKTFTRSKPNQFQYTIDLPMAPLPGQKPLQTHLDEVNLSMNVKGYSYSITVDPIRINSLREFGTPDEVAAKIVMAELRRDGILDVSVGRDPVEDERTGGYDVEYISDGKRGKKHFITRTIVNSNKLFVLTAQVKQDDWNSNVHQDEVWKAVNSFTVLDPSSSP